MNSHQLYNKWFTRKYLFEYIWVSAYTYQPNNRLSLRYFQLFIAFLNENTARLLYQNNFFSVMRDSNRRKISSYNASNLFGVLINTLSCQLSFPTSLNEKICIFIPCYFRVKAYFLILLYIQVYTVIKHAVTIDWL
jgi:hypothetical protein